jgi:hypothetical protein
VPRSQTIFNSITILNNRSKIHLENPLRKRNLKSVRAQNQWANLHRLTRLVKALSNLKEKSKISSSKRMAKVALPRRGMSTSTL